MNCASIGIHTDARARSRVRLLRALLFYETPVRATRLSKSTVIIKQIESNSNEIVSRVYMCVRVRKTRAVVSLHTHRL